MRFSKPEDKGFVLIEKTLTLIEMIHADPERCAASGEVVKLAPSTYAQLAYTLEETKRFHAEIKEVLQRAVDHAETHDDYDWIGAADNLLKTL